MHTQEDKDRQVRRRSATSIAAGMPSDEAAHGRNRSRDDRGFTLLEVMIALAIVGTVLVALLGLGNRTISAGDRVQKLTRATMLAQAKMTEVELEATSGAQLTLQDQEGVFEEPFAEFRWRSSFTPTLLDQVQQVVVTVAWGDEARNEAVDLTSFVLRP